MRCRSAVLVALLSPCLLIGQTFIASDGLQVGSCTGYFYDSGGPTGNYSASEDITVTICPFGGSGAGPATSVFFEVFDVQLLALTDQLVLHDGATTADPVLVTGGFLSNLTGQGFVATGPTGCLTFHWTSDLLINAPGWVVRITTAPGAGTNGTAATCSTGAPFNMAALLGGTPDPGGSWVAPGGGAHSGTFDPSVDPGGSWTYSHTGPAPCPVTSATLTITKITAPSAGTNGAATFCSNGPSTPLIGFLGGSPEPGGSWTAPGGDPHSGTFVPGTDPPGGYTYTVIGTPPCANASATVTVTVNTPSNAGVSGSISVCSNNAPFQLFSVLTGSPQATGAWTGPGGGPVADTYTPGTSTPGVYTYTVPGNPPCVSASSTVTVSETAAPNAGIDRSITVCSSDAVFQLASMLNGTPNAGGTWVGPGGAHGPNFNPAIEASGAYVYTVIGTSPCANAAATLTITVRQAPRAGTSASVTLCSTDGVYQLFGALTGSPDVGGTWQDPSAQAHSGSFQPGTSAPGVYTYTVTGQAPCTPASSTVTVAVNTAPNAGMGVSVSRCSNDVAFNLFNVLGGTPTSGGTWTGPLGAHSATFTPGTDQPGNYTYTVLGVAPCANATAIVSVTVIQAPNAGTNGSITVCASDPSFGLFDQLGGTPDATGTWTAPGGGANNGTFVPGTSPGGTYTYTVAGTAPCTNRQATVQVTVVPPPNAGTAGTVTVCSSDGPVDLFAALGGSPDAGGTWTRPDATAHSGTYLPGSQPGGNYTYTVQGTAPCTNRSAVVQVIRVIAPNAGVNGSITVCSTNGPFQLISVLGGSPNGTGAWSNAANNPVSGTFTPGITAPGLFKYIVTGTPPCVNDTGFVTVNVNQAPNAGQNASILVCSSAATFPLIGVLGGTPDPGGSWVGPTGSAVPSGNYTPGTSLPGGYTYTVAGQTPCLAATAVVTVSQNRQPVAGTNGSFTRCSTDGAVDLFLQLGGTPDNGGSWTGPGGPSSGVFNPATSPSGVYVYTVLGTAPCTNATATVMATVNAAPNAGIGGTLTICQGTTSVDLFTGLTGTPDLTGTWSEVNTSGNLSANFFTPSGLPAGDYDFLYTVPGIGQCLAATATVRVTIVPDLEAGSNGNLPACRSNTQVNLFNGLGGSPQPGGQWIDLNATNALTGQFFNATMVAPGSYQFRYRLTGIAGCDSDSATVTVTVVAAPDAGGSSTTVVCSDGASFNLFNVLNGSPQSGGSWHRGAQNGPGFSGMYNPNIDDPNIFYYRVNGTPPCTTVYASVTVQEVQAANAGSPNSRQICSNAAPFNMTQALGGTPDPGGTWYFNNQNHDVLFVPGLDVQGVYEYRVQGQFPCTEKITFLTVSVTNSAYAGCNSSVTKCTNDADFLLFNFLCGTPDNGGSWLDPNLVAHSGSFDPGVSLPGDYRYIVTGTAPCVNDTAIVSVFIDPSPNAGIPGNASLCAGGPPVNLINYLGGTPDPFGTWVGPGPTNPPFSGIFTPGGPTPSAPGTYTYSVTNSCGTATATVGVVVSSPSNAGCSMSIVRCSSDPAFSMVAQLSCSPALGGSWFGPLSNNPAPMDGVFAPGGATPTPPGTYRYTVPGVGACPAATATLTITVNPQTNAGVSTSIALCATDGDVSLFPLLGPTAQAGGVWTFNGQPHSGTVIPSSDQTGPYIYTVTGMAPCASSTAQVFVQISQPPFAGNDGLVHTCSSAAPFTLFPFLTGGAQFGGLWFGPTGGSQSGIFTPGSDPGGAYKYRLPSIGACPADSAYVTVIQNDAVHAGENGTVEVCSNAADFPLFAHLTGTPQPGGDWYGPGGAPFNGTYFPGTSTPGVYKYKRVGTAPCPSDSATVTVVQYTAPNAGISTLSEQCSTGGQVALIDLLAGAPDLNGAWTYNGDPDGPFFDPATDLPGPYLYTVQGQAPCLNATAQVVITVINAPIAGTNGSITVCLNANAIQLPPVLGGNPTTGGTWINQCGQGVLTNGVFDATGMPAGSSCVLTYSHAITGPCPAVSAEVTVNIVAALDAGMDASTQACLGQLVDLFATLGGTPQTGGGWINTDNASGFIGGVFNTAMVPAGTSWRFDYVLPGSVECDPDTGRVTVDVLAGPFAGGDGNLTLCSSSLPVNMATSLGGSPDGGGAWFTNLGDPHSNFFDPAVDATGVYWYVVPGFGACPEDSAKVTVQVVAAPNAGTDAQLAICSNDLPVDMFPLLGPNAQTGGSWTQGSVTPHGNVYNPIVDTQGSYRYTVPGNSPCASAIAIVEVTEPQAPRAGIDAQLNLCSSASPLNMFISLGTPTPTPGGSWTYVTGGNLPHGIIFDPASDLPGVYRYIVIGTAPCAADTAELTIGVTTAGNAGQSATIQACLVQTEINIFTALGPNAQSGGSWNDLDGSQALAGNLFNPSLAGNGTWHFIYTIASSGLCPSVNATITVGVGVGGSAGNDSTVAICGAETAYDLFTALGGNPSTGGTWNDPSGSGALSPDGILNVSILPTTGMVSYQYTVNDPGCGTLTATVHVSAAPYPNAGAGGPVVVCSNGHPVELFEQLSSDAEPGGTWTDPFDTAHNGTFDPAVDGPGEYTYTVLGISPCANATAVLSITVNQPPDAGANGTLLVCDTLTALALFPGLNGSPQSGGTWSDVNGTGGLSGGSLNTTGIPPGEYDYRYGVTVPACGTATALVMVTVVSTVEVVDVVRTCDERDRTYTVSFTLLGGDTASYEVTGLSGSMVAGQSHVFTSTAIITAEPFQAFVRDRYGCGEVKVEGVSPCDFENDVFVPESFSPNGDGTNEQFIIPGIEGYPNNTIVIFNRWGAKMYEATGYDNKSVVWDGTSPSAAIGGTAPAGTYFYVLELGNGKDAITGFIYLNR